MNALRLDVERLAEMNCPLCDCVAPSLPLLLRHIGRVHASSDGFSMQCGVDGCKRTYKNFRKFKEHLKSAHKEYLPRQVLYYQVL